MKLWQKITFLNISIILSLGLLIGLFLLDVCTKFMRAELTNKGMSIAQNLSDRIADSILMEDLYKIYEALNEVQGKERDIEYIFLTDERGRVFAHTFKNGYPSDLLSWNPLNNRTQSSQLLETEKGFIRDIGLKIFEGMKSELHLGFKEERISALLNSMKNLIVLLTLIVIGIGAAVSFFLSKIITKPIYALVEFTKSLSAGEFGKKIEVLTKDEVGQLAKTFNKLSGELKDYKEKMAETYQQMLRMEKLAATGRLLAGLSHEIKNPLTSIKMLFQAFKGNTKPTPEDLEVILTEIRRIDNLLTKFLNFNREKLFSPAEIIEINTLIKEILDLATIKFKDQKVLLETKFKDNLKPVKGDRSLLGQVFFNLIINALEAMPNGGILGIVTDEDNNFITVQIKDTGGGISPDIENNIFDPFFTTKSGGTGLGLYIVQNVVTAHKGRVIFKSQNGRTAFTIFLPNIAVGDNE